MKDIKEEYLARARTLDEEQQERILSRMTGKLPKRLEKDKLTREEAIAIQLELEDEQLAEWRKRMHDLKEKAGKRKTEDKPVEAKPKQAEKKVASKATAKEREAGRKAEKPSQVSNLKATALAPKASSARKAKAA